MMNENRFTPRAEEALRLARRPPASWATAMWVPSICCWVFCGKRTASPTVSWREHGTDGGHDRADRKTGAAVWAGSVRAATLPRG